MNPKSKIILKLAGLFLFLVALFGVLVVSRAHFAFSDMAIDSPAPNGGKKEASLFDALPQNNPRRTNVLLLGIRGEESPYGGLLTDAIMVVSASEETGEIARISIPRDLYVRLPGSKRKERINYAYAYGLNQGGVSQGIDYAKRVVARVTGLYIDYTVVAEMDALKQAVNILGGIDIYLKEPFVEDQQWYCDKEGKNCWEFRLPAGENHLNGRQTLFYIRSRFSSSDFDRARRQQQILSALKEKLFSLNFLSNPVRAFNLLDLVEGHIRTDMDKKTLLGFIHKAKSKRWDLENIQSLILRIGPMQPLKAETRKGSYILVPKRGDWSKLHKLVEDLIR